MTTREARTIEQIDADGNGMTLDEFNRVWSQHGPFELVDGKRVQKMPPKSLHSFIVRYLFRLLDAYCIEQGIAQAFSETTYITAQKSDWVKGSRIPDLMIIQSDTLQQYINDNNDWDEKPLTLTPLLTIEVVSPSDSYSDIQEKVSSDLDAGVKLIWVIDPQRKRATIYEGITHRTVQDDAALAGDDILPGFVVQLADIFDTDKLTSS